MPPELAGISVADPAEAWRAAGFAVDDAGIANIGAVALSCLGRDGHEGRDGITGWSFAGLSDAVEGVDALDLDGLETKLAVAGSESSQRSQSHPNGAMYIDHVVVLTPNVVRSVETFETWGFEVRRVRDVPGEHPRRQVFFRAGEVIVELVGPQDSDADADGRGAGFFGIAVAVEDLDATAVLLGESIGRTKQARQEGRRIATLRSSAVGISTAVAFMSAESFRPSK